MTWELQVFGNTFTNQLCFRAIQDFMYIFYGFYMKQIQLLVSFLFIIFLVVTSSFTSSAQPCPPGWNTSSFLTIVDLNGCQWQIDVCYKCGITGASPANVRITNIKPVPNNIGCVSPDKNWLANQISIIYFNTLCTIPPCDEGCQSIIIEYPTCFEWRAYGTYENGVYSYTNPYQAPCSSVNTYCQIEDRVCRDYQTGIVQRCPNWNVRYTTYGTGCPLNYIPIPTQPYGVPNFIGENSISPCFTDSTVFCR
jgi:hypothetical protein